MKVRLGFVSNSSSASYVVEIGLTKKDFIDFMFKEWGDKKFNKQKFIQVLNKEIKAEVCAIKKYKEKIEIDPKCIESLWILQSESRLSSLEKILKKATEAYGKNLVGLIIEIEGYKIHENIFNRVELSGFTTMYNDEGSMGKLLNEIIELVEEKFIKHRVHVEGD